MIKVIIFDIDGTIVSAYDAIQKSLNFTLARLGYKKRAAITTVRASIGLGDKNFIDRFFPKKDREKAIAIYRERHMEDLVSSARVLPGAIRALSVLKKRGYKLGIASNRPRKFSMVLLKSLGIDRYFDVILCAKDKADIKPKPKLLLDTMRILDARACQTLFVGDMVIDVRAGKRAGVKTIAIKGGSSTLKDLAEAKPYKIISKLPELLKIIEAENGC